MNKKELAIQLHDMKYNCAQAVACAFAEEVGVDREILFKACEGLGFGMGCMEGTCGALSGACALAGFQNSDGNIDAPGTKASTYALSKQIVEKFAAKNHATRCRDLKGIGSADGQPLRPCPDCITDAIEIVQEVLGL